MRISYKGLVFQSRDYDSYYDLSSRIGSIYGYFEQRRNIPGVGPKELFYPSRIVGVLPAEASGTGAEFSRAESHR